MASSSVPAISAAANTPIIRTTKTHWRAVMVHDPRAEGLGRQAARRRSTIGRMANSVIGLAQRLTSRAVARMMFWPTVIALPMVSQVPRLAGLDELSAIGARVTGGGRSRSRARWNFRVRRRGAFGAGAGGGIGSGRSNSPPYL